MEELWNSRPRISPANLLRGLAEECTKLNIQSCDMYGDFEASKDQSYLRRFESEISETFGKEDAIFLPSGVMAQQIALNIHYDAAISAGKHVDRAFVCHYSSHILIHEKDTCSHLLKMDPIIVSKKENTVHQEPISYADIVNKFNPTSSTISNNPCAVIIECPHREIGGKCTPYEDLEKISEHCRQAGVALHMDGARLWEATAHYTTSTTSTGMSVTSKDLCNLFDSIYVSCYKGIGGMTGAVLLGKADFIAEARVWLRRFGGNLFTLLPYAVSSYSSYRNFVAWNMSSSLKEASPPDVATVSGAPLPVPYSMPARRARMQAVVALLSKAKELQPFVRFDPPVPEVSLVHVYIRGSVVTVREAHEASKQETGIACFNAVRPAPTIIGADAFNFPEECYFEFNMGILNGTIPDKSWVRGWIALVNELSKRL